MPEERLDELLARLERERAEADRAYDDALTRLDTSLVGRPEMPHPPPAYDESRLPAINAAWDLLPAGPPPIDRSLKGRLRGLIWRIAGPPLETQRQFNAAVVDHLNRNAIAHREAAKAAASTIDVLRDHIDALLRMQAALLSYLQTVTFYVDTKDRATGGLTHVLNAGLAATSDDWMKRWDTLGAREQRFMGRLSDMDDVRAASALAQQTALTLKREVERLVAAGATDRAATDGGPSASSARPAPDPAATAPTGGHTTAAERTASAVPDLDAYKYLGFEESFRGSADEIRARLTSYLPLFEGRTDVLDIGCGRGEFLELLRDAGIAARGLDLNHEMAEASRARGLDVVEGDALQYLEGLPDQSLGGLFAAQVVEHLEPAYLARLLEIALHKLRPEGVLALETINTACWVAFFESYIRDLTHVRPLHPETLQFLVRASGFRDVRIEFRSPIPTHERLQPVFAPASLPADLADFVEVLNSNTEKLNSRIYTHMDYAVVARR